VSIDNPSKDFLDSAPGSIALLKFLDRDRFFAMVVSVVEGTENIVDGVQQHSADMPAARDRALTHTQKIIHKNVEGAETGTTASEL
jgi:hypothetical protein